MNKKIKVIIGMSGGVDSAVAAYILKQQGYEVEGLFMRNWDSLLNNDIKGNSTINDSVCPQEQDWIDAKKSAEIIGIKIHRVDFIKEYWNNVFENFISEYKLGRTPNPDILCNKFIKFDKMLNYAIDNLGADYLSTGHYVKTKRDSGVLERGLDELKDQSYFLSQLSKEQIQKTIFPLGDMRKIEVREIAKKIKLNVANKKDSTGICFIGERDFVEFLQNYIPAQKGNVVDIETGNILGQHSGTMYYTLGQRKGLALGGMKEPYFVVSKDIDKKIIYVAPASKTEYLMSDSLEGSSLNIINSENIESLEITAKFRYRQTDVLVYPEFDWNNKTVKVIFDSPQLSITPGQQIVFYSGNVCLGGAIIEKTFFKNKENGCN